MAYVDKILVEALKSFEIVDLGAIVPVNDETTPLVQFLFDKFRNSDAILALRGKTDDPEIIWRLLNAEDRKFFVEKMGILNGLDTLRDVSNFYSAYSEEYDALTLEKYVDEMKNIKDIRIEEIQFSIWEIDSTTELRKCVGMEISEEKLAKNAESTKIYEGMLAQLKEKSFPELSYSEAGATILFFTLFDEIVKQTISILESSDDE